MLRELEAPAVRLGHRRIVLDTDGTLTEAIAMYGRSGDRAVARYNDHPYAEGVVGEGPGLAGGHEDR